jgi:hypothetical protein
MVVGFISVMNRKPSNVSVVIKNSTDIKKTKNKKETKKKHEQPPLISNHWT